MLEKAASEMCDWVLNTPLVRMKYIIATEKLRWELHLLNEMLVVENYDITQYESHYESQPKFYHFIIYVLRVAMKKTMRAEGGVIIESRKTITYKSYCND